MKKKLISLALATASLVTSLSTASWVVQAEITNTSQVTSEVTTDTENISTKLIMQLGSRYVIKDDRLHLINYTDTSITPKRINGYDFVPLRFLAEVFGAEVEWDEYNSTATVTNRVNDTEYELILAPNTSPVSYSIAHYTDEGWSLTSRAEYLPNQELPFILDDTLMVPLTFVAEHIDLRVFFKEDYLFVTNNGGWTVDFFDKGIAFCTEYVEKFKNYDTVTNVYLNDSINRIPIKRAAQILGTYYIPVEDLPQYGYEYYKPRVSCREAFSFEPALKDGVLEITSVTPKTKDIYYYPAKYEDLTYLKPVLGSISDVVVCKIIAADKIFNTEVFKINDDYLVALDDLKQVPVQLNLENALLAPDTIGEQLKSDFKTALKNDFTYLKYAYDNVEEYNYKVNVYPNNATVPNTDYVGYNTTDKEGNYIYFPRYCRICEGYAILFKEYCDRAWISCHVTSSYKYDSDYLVRSNMLMNKVFYNGTYRYVDTNCFGTNTNEEYKSYFVEDYIFLKPQDKVFED